MSVSGDRSSNARRRALRRLAREQHAAYAEIYEQVRPAAPTRHHACERARTQLRYRYPARYLELFAEERASAGTDVPGDIRGKSWQRAVARLADLRAPVYRELFAQFRAQGMNRPRAYERAMAALREADSDLFIRVLAEEYQMCSPSRPPTSSSRRKRTCIPAVCRRYAGGPDDLPPAGQPATRALR